MGATPSVSSAPAIPTTPKSTDYPPLDAIPDVNSPEVKKWVSEIDWDKVPKYGVTTGECASSPEATKDGRCWWTCGGCTRDTDITVCPDQYTWGLSYDDGPSPYTPLLLDYLEEQKIKSTFFLVGSRVVSRPEMVVSEYMLGHQLSIHTWSHPSLTKLTNEEIVAELGWTKKAIKDVVGVTPNTFRPPYGDLDDRVRAIAAQMGLTPVMWTDYQGTTFDTDDWRIVGGTASGPSSLTKFQRILDEYVPKLDTGFIMLEHDIYSQTVDLAVGYFLPMAIASGKYKMKSIIECLGLGNEEAYIETSSNTTNTLILSATGTGTVYQASVGSVTGSAPVVTASSGNKDAKATGSEAGKENASGANALAASLSVALAALVAGIAFF